MTVTVSKHGLIDTVALAPPAPEVILEATGHAWIWSSSSACLSDTGGHNGPAAATCAAHPTQGSRAR